MRHPSDRPTLLWQASLRKQPHIQKKKKLFAPSTYIPYVLLQFLCEYEALVAHGLLPILVEILLYVTCNRDCDSSTIDESSTIA